MELFNEYNNSEVQFLLNLFSQNRKLNREDLLQLAQDSHVYEYKGEYLPQEKGCDYENVIDKYLRLGVIEEREPGFFAINRLLHSFAAPLCDLEEEYLRDICGTAEASLFLSPELQEKLASKSSLFDCVNRMNSEGKAEEISHLNVTVFRTLLMAIHDHRGIKYEYVTVNNSTPQVCECAVPYRLEYNVFDGRWWLITYNEQEDRTIKAKLENIRKVTPLTIHYVPEETIRQAIERKLSPNPLVLRIRDERNALERCIVTFESGQDAGLTQISENEYELRFRYFSWDESAIVRKLMNLGEMITVLEPESVKTALVSELEFALNQNRGQ